MDDRSRTPLALSLLWLLLASVLWAWPLHYLLNRGEGCGADIGIGLFGLPLTLIGIIGAFVMALRYRGQRSVVTLSLLAVAVGVSSLVGLLLRVGPYGEWLRWAIDNWYGSC